MPASSIGRLPPTKTGWERRRRRRPRRCGRRIAQRLGQLISRLKPSWPAPRTDRKDPYAIRSALLLAVVAALLATGGNGWNHLRAAFSPASSSAPALLRLDAWVTPPIYTGLPPIVLADGNEAVGAGAEILPRAVGARAQRTDRAHARAAGRDREPRHQPRRRRRQDHRAEARRQPRADRVQRGAEPAGQRRCEDWRPHRFQMAFRSDQGPAADHQSDGHAVDHAARRAAAGVSRRRRQRRGQRRGALRARRRRGTATSPRCRPRPAPRSRPTPCSSRR